MKITPIVGARPQFIKCAQLSREIRKKFEEILIHTGQHYNFEMAELFFQELGIPNHDYNLGIGSGSHGQQTWKRLIEIEKILLKEKPDLVLVYGYTTLSGALAASKLHISIAHVEAGLCSFDRTMPKETNRVLTNHVSDLLLCPTHTAVFNIGIEGITHGVNNAGDVMVDVLEYNYKIGKKKSRILENKMVNNK
jgi:UDP-GlcNAc3NAcA epimerase